MINRNPKQEGTNLYDCIPQIGECPNNCNQCFYNQEGAFFTDINTPHIPNIIELPEDAIIRMNSGNDSNNQKELVLETAKQYHNVFFNTSIPKLDFPGPVVLTINPKEEQKYYTPGQLPILFNDLNKIMFLRFRCSSTNLSLLKDVIYWYTKEANGYKFPIVITFMRYYDNPPDKINYEYKKHILNSCWVPTKEFMKSVMKKYEGNRLVSMCGSIDSSYCRDCRNCELRYWETVKRLRNE